MKKLAVLFVCVAMLASCDSFKGGSKDLKAENDSLLMELNQRNAELDDMMGTFNEFRKVSVRSMLPKAVLTCNVEPSLKTLPAPSNRLLLTSNSSPNKWKKTKRRLQSCRHS